MYEELNHLNGKRPIKKTVVPFHNLRDKGKSLKALKGEKIYYLQMKKKYIISDTLATLDLEDNGTMSSKYEENCY